MLTWRGNCDFRFRIS